MMKLPQPKNTKLSALVKKVLNYVPLTSVGKKLDLENQIADLQKKNKSLGSELSDCEQRLFHLESDYFTIVDKFTPRDKFAPSMSDISFYETFEENRVFTFHVSYDTLNYSVTVDPFASIDQISSETKCYIKQVAKTFAYQTAEQQADYIYNYMVGIYDRK